tara:strand:+ start:238 stop:702 length:465 start_codon:yes stop_codon:yes gene_type:complete
MKRKLKSIFVFSLLLLVSHCGYTPLINSEKINFNINSLNFEGDREINNILSKNLNVYKKPGGNENNYNIFITSNYDKTVVNRDSSGDPKNYNISVKTDIKYVLPGGNESSKSFERNISLAAQNKKITEKKLESKYKKNLSNQISQDIIFLLSNN